MKSIWFILTKLELNIFQLKMTLINMTTPLININDNIKCHVFRHLITFILEKCFDINDIQYFSQNLRGILTFLICDQYHHGS